MTPIKAEQQGPYIRTLGPRKFILEGPWTEKFKATIFGTRAAAEDALAICIIRHFDEPERIVDGHDRARALGII